MAGFGSIANSLAKNVLSGAKNLATNFIDDVGSTYIPDYKPINSSYTSTQNSIPQQPTISDLLNQTAQSAFNNIDSLESKQPNIQDITKEGFKNITDIFGDSLTDNIAKNINSSSEKEKTRLSNAWNNYIADPNAIIGQNYSDVYANSNERQRAAINDIARAFWEWSPTQSNTIQRSLDDSQLSSEAIPFQTLQDFYNQTTSDEAKDKVASAYADMVARTADVLAAPIGIKAPGMGISAAANQLEKGLTKAGQATVNTVKGAGKELSKRGGAKNILKGDEFIGVSTPLDAKPSMFKDSILSLEDTAKSLYEATKNANKKNNAADLFAENVYGMTPKAATEAADMTTKQALKNTLGGLATAGFASIPALTALALGDQTYGLTPGLESYSIFNNPNNNKDMAYHGNFFDDVFGKGTTARMMANGNLRNSAWDYANDLSPEERTAKYLSEINEYYGDEGPGLGDWFHTSIGNLASGVAMNADPDLALDGSNPLYKFFNNMGFHNYNRTTKNDGANPELNPLVNTNYVQHKRGADDLTANDWKVLIDTNAAPKQYDQEDRFLYNITQTPEGRRWIEEAIPDIFENLSEEELKNGYGNLDNAFTKWRLVTLNNTEDGLAGSMGDSVDRLWGDIFSDATGIPLERGKDGKLTEESKNLVDQWATSDENIFYLDQYLNNPNYINDPTFLNYGFDANAITDLTQFLANRGVIPLDIQDQYGTDVANQFDADDLAQYMTMALLQRQNGGSGKVGKNQDNQQITERTLNQIFPLAGDVSFTRSAKYGTRPEDQDIHAMRTLNPGNENDWYKPVLVDENNNPIPDPTLSDRFASTVLAMNPDMYIYDPKKYKAVNEKTPEKAASGSGFVVSPYDENVPLMNPMWW